MENQLEDILCDATIIIPEPLLYIIFIHSQVTLYSMPSTALIHLASLFNAIKILM